MVRSVHMLQRFAVILALCGLLAAGAGCADKAQTGAGIGALSGALVGSLVSGNKLVGAGIGAGIGLALGYIVGNEWDKYDQRQLNQTLETTPSGETSTWVNPDTHQSYQATPQPAYTSNGRVYRDVTIKTEVDGKPQDVQAKAYREPDGTWHLVQ